ncbi:MAG TPA: prepilin-type N-terminal cleavage/methylation domain-containing protein [Phycisphaerae bacterium]|nr:prepilin-type N-terminal cleavage/methylation domain-containing protein [Phycisphaerae bacterium]HNU45290.1 prepilin-type N-terminal cleavage/methylation domain-containing protein [Phycisphaerae bacterium]
MRRKRAFTLVELLVVIAIIALLISILLPSLSRARELSKRLVCGSNTKSLGTSSKIYANDNQERWMIPGFKQAAINTPGIQYTDGDNGLVGNDNRTQQSTKETSTAPNAGSTRVSVTRSFWMLVRSGEVTVNQFICPSSGDVMDETENVDFYYDFLSYVNISYGYQVPFGPRDTQPREGMDNRQVVAGDKGPWYVQGGDPNWSTGAAGLVTANDSPKAWRTFNSPNHGGSSNGEGQNLLFADGHSSFMPMPAVGIDHDNVFTLMADTWTPQLYNLLHGDVPLRGPNGWPYPGMQAFNSTNTGYSSTDSLIYP